GRIGHAERRRQGAGAVDGLDLVQRGGPHVVAERGGALGALDRAVVDRDNPAADLQHLRRGDGRDRGPLEALDILGAHPFSRISRALPRCQSRSAVTWRLSWAFLPVATAISSFARPLSLQ